MYTYNTRLMKIRYTINRFIRDTISSRGRGMVLDNGEHGNRGDVNRVTDGMSIDEIALNLSCMLNID